MAKRTTGRRLKLAELFIENFEKYKEGSSAAIINAGPKLPA
jgi:ATP-dependent phosphoenolpyruvate carboxykinase